MYFAKVPVFPVFVVFPDFYVYVGVDVDVDEMIFYFK